MYSLNLSRKLQKFMVKAWMSPARICWLDSSCSLNYSPLSHLTIQHWCWQKKIPWFCEFEVIIYLRIVTHQQIFGTRLFQNYQKLEGLFVGILCFCSLKRNQKPSQRCSDARILHGSTNQLPVFLFFCSGFRSLRPPHNVSTLGCGGWVLSKSSWILSAWLQHVGRRFHAFLPVEFGEFFAMMVWFFSSISSLTTTEISPIGVLFLKLSQSRLVRYYWYSYILLIEEILDVSNCVNKGINY